MKHKIISIILAVIMLVFMPIYTSAISKETVFVVNMVRNNQFESQEFWGNLNYSRNYVSADTDWNTAIPNNDDITRLYAAAGITYYYSNIPEVTFFEDLDRVTVNSKTYVSYRIEPEDNMVLINSYSRHKAIVEIGTNTYDSGYVVIYGDGFNN